MTTITVGTRLSVSPDVADEVKAALAAAASAVLKEKGLDGSILIEAVGTDPETGETVKKSKKDYVSSYVIDAAPGDDF